MQSLQLKLFVLYTAHPKLAGPKCQLAVSRFRATRHTRDRFHSAESMKL